MPPLRRRTPEQRRLLAWGESVRRDLPWRRTRDPWLILLSEVMLQQTQASRVAERFEGFAERWPTPAALAATESREVLLAWSGLGYPRRARNLLAAARLIVDVHDGSVPDRLDDLLALPGVGPYTARAVLTFAFERDGVGVVDTNIARVLARRAGHVLNPRNAQALADAFVPVGDSWQHNQSLMDLGALLCRPAPICDACPIARWCTWTAAGQPVPDPAIGSAGVSARQARFEGSDRQLRGRILTALAAGPATDAYLVEAAGSGGNEHRVPGLLQDLLAEALVSQTKRGWELGSGS